MTVFLETLWSSIKEVKPPFVFYVEHGIALEAMQGNRASSHSEGRNLMVFLELRWEPGASSRVTRGLFFKHSCLVSRDTSGFSSRQGSTGGTPLELRRETQGPFLVTTGIFEFLSVFKRSQALCPVEACKYAFLWRCQRDVNPPVEMRWGTKALSRVSTGHSDTPSCCERKHGLAFESLQGNQALPRVRKTRCPFHLSQQTQGTSHIPITERSLLFRCLWKIGIPLVLKPGNQLSS